MSERSTFSPLQNSSIVGSHIDNRLYVLENHTQRFIIGTVFVAISIIGSIGNSLVILAIALSRKLRNATNCFVGNLACADLLSCLWLPFNAIAMLSITGWHLPDWICTLVGTVSMNCVGASVLTLAFTAFNRWYLLSRSKEMFQKLYTPRNITLMMLFTWFYPFLLLVVPHFSGYITLGYSYEYKLCAVDTGSERVYYFCMMAGLLIILPAFAAILVIYFRIYRLVAKHEWTMQSRLGIEVSDHNKMALGNGGYEGTSHHPAIASSDDPSSEVVPDDGNTQATHSRRDSASNQPVHTITPHNFPCDLQNKNQSDQTVEVASISANTHAPVIILPSDLDPPYTNAQSDQVQQACITLPVTQRERLPKQERCEDQVTTLNRTTVRITKKLAIIIVVYVIFILPFGIGTLLLAPSSRPAVPWDYLLLVFNSCLNPIIYARTMRSFREVMGCIVRGRFDRIPDPIHLVRRMRRRPLIV